MSRRSQLDDSLLQPFEFVDPKLVSTEEQLRNFAASIRGQRESGDRLDAETRDRLSNLAKSTLAAAEIVKIDVTKIQSELSDIVKSLTEDDAAQLQLIVQQESSRLEDFFVELNDLETRIGEFKTGNEDDANSLDDAESIRNDLLLILSKLSVVQIIMRVELIPIQPFDLSIDMAAEQAVRYRLDLKNQKARVMDSRRDLEIVADQLESKFDLVLEGEVNTKPLGDTNKPFDFRAKQSRFRGGVQIDTPLDQVAERNNFRAAQIGYQRARRNYVALEDSIKLDVRQAVRTLIAKADEISQRQRRIQYAARELELSATEADATQRGLSLNNALRSLNRAQDELIENWLDYETTRLNLYRDTGLMQINEVGFWEDAFYLEMFDKEP